MGNWTRLERYSHTDSGGQELVLRRIFVNDMKLTTDHLPGDRLADRQAIGGHCTPLRRRAERTDNANRESQTALASTLRNSVL